MITFKQLSKYDIHIEHTANAGIIVTIGCCKTVFSNPEDLLNGLAQYYNNPEEMEKKYNQVVSPADESIGYGIGYGNMPQPDNRALRRSGPHDDPGCSCQKEIPIDNPGNN